MKNILFASCLLLFNSLCTNHAFAQRDINFGIDGLFSIADRTRESQCTHISLDAENSIFALGRMNLSAGSDVLFLMKIDSNGQSKTLGKGETMFLPQRGYNQVPFDLNVYDNQPYIVFTEFIDTNYQGNLIRLKANGELDSSFGLNGRFNLPLESNQDIFYTQVFKGKAGVIYLNGGVNIRTDTSRSGIIVKLSANGKIDTTFGTMGIKNYSLQHNEFPSIMAIDSNLEVLYMANVSPFKSEIEVTRLKQNGQIDSSFGNAGKSVIKSTVAALFSKKVMVLPNSKIVIAAQITHSTSLIKSGLYLVNEDGTLNQSFGKNGLALIDQFPKLNTAEIIALNVDSHQNFVLGYSSPTNTNKYLAAVGIHSNGTVNDSFVDGGLLYEASYNPMNMLIDKENRLVFCGKYPDFVVSRYLSDARFINGTMSLDKFGFVISPNPNSGNFKIEFDHMQNVCSYKIFTLQGEEVLTGNIQSNETGFDFSKTLVKGLYLIGLYDKSQNLLKMEKLSIQ